MLTNCRMLLYRSHLDGPGDDAESVHGLFLLLGEDVLQGTRSPELAQGLQAVLGACLVDSLHDLQKIRASGGGGGGTWMRTR